MWNTKEYLKKLKENPKEYQAHLAKKRAYKNKQSASEFEFYKGVLFCVCGTCSTCGKNDVMITHRSKICIICHKIIQQEKSKIWYEKSKLRILEKSKTLYAKLNPKPPELHLCVPHSFKKYGKSFCIFGTCSRCYNKHVMTSSRYKHCINCVIGSKPPELHLCLPPGFKKYGRNFCDFDTCSGCGNKLIMVTHVNKECVECVKMKGLKRSKIYSKTSRILALTLLFPPVGSASILPQTKHVTLEDAFPNITCSFLHLGHLILMNLLVCSLVI